jgi:hypothetical protein
MTQRTEYLTELLAAAAQAAEGDSSDAEIGALSDALNEALNLLEEPPTHEFTDAALKNLKDLAATERILRQGDPYYEGDECSTYDHEVTPDVVAGLCYEIERLRRQQEQPIHQFTGTVKRADGITVTATLTVPNTHPMAQPGPHRPWHGPERSNQNFLELGELAMMIAQQGYGIIERNERSRAHWGKQDYWADLLDITPPTPAIEAMPGGRA